MTFEIRSEDDLFQAIALLDGGEWPNDQEVRFVDWPRYEITIRGEDFDGGLPTRIIPVLLKLQSTVKRAYSRSIYGEVRSRLPYADLKRTELIVCLDPGSTAFTFDLVPVLNHIVETVARKMTGKEITITILGVTAILVGGSVLKTWINAEARQRGIDSPVRLSEQETEQCQILKNMEEQYPDVAEHCADMKATYGELVKRLEGNDRIFIGGEEIVSGSIGKRILQKEQTIHAREHLDADFMILSLKSGEVHAGFRSRVQDIVSGEIFELFIPQDALSPREIELLQSSEWKKEPRRMRIEVVRAGKPTEKARLISVSPATKFDD